MDTDELDVLAPTSNRQEGNSQEGNSQKDRKHAIKKAMDYLSRREHSCYELSQKLIRSGFDLEMAGEAIEDLQNRGLLSDFRFAEAYIRFRRSKGFGPVRIKLELSEKGVDPSILEEILTQNNYCWIDNAVGVREKKFGFDKPREFKERARQARFLQYRGFTSEQINQAIESNP